MTLDQAKSKSIFLADDDDDDCMLFIDALKELNIDSQVIVANDGVELMSTLDDMVPPSPYVIFLDLNMPRKNGFECLKELKQTPKLKDIPIVIFSTTCTAEVVDRTYHAGANYYVCKPSSFPLLIKALENVLSLDMNQLHKQPERNLFVLMD
jgi:CheY-like chemotaxis protein